MKRFTALTLVALGLLAGGCQQSAQSMRSPASSMIQVCDGQRSVSCSMRGEQTVSDALRQTLKPTNAPHRRTVVLLRRSPEGQEQTLIDIDSAGRPIDPAQDVILREGDELVLPAQSMPDGLQRPPVLAIDGPPSQPYVGP